MARMSFLGDPIGWLEDAWYRSQDRADIPRVLTEQLRELPETARVLDFGAGTGHVSRALRLHVPANYTLADVDATALASQATPDDGFTRVTLPKYGPLPFGEAVFDAIFLVDVFHHLDAPRRTLLELRRILRPGGLLLLVEYDTSRAPARLLNLVCRIAKGRWRLYSPAHLRAALARGGFEATTTRLDELRILMRARRRP